jgi:hypothetical protein
LLLLSNQRFYCKAVPGSIIIRRRNASRGDKGLFQAAWNSFAVKALVAQQQKAAADVDLRGVPAIFVNGAFSGQAAGYFWLTRNFTTFA